MADIDPHDLNAPAAPTNSPLKSPAAFCSSTSLRCAPINCVEARACVCSCRGPQLPHRLERAAMDEVKHRLVQYSVPDTPGLSLK